MGASASHPRFRVGLLVPSSNTVMENDLHRALSKSQYTVHTARMFLVETTPEAEMAMIEAHAAKAAQDLGTVRPDMMVFGCTSAGALYGLGHDRAVCEKLGAIAACPTLGAISCVWAALTKRELRRVAVITPYVQSLSTAVGDALQGGGIEAVAVCGMGISNNVALADPTPEEILRFTLEHLRNVKFDGLFVSCTNFRALEAEPALEQALNVPVVTSNSAVVEAVREFFEDLTR